MAKRKDKPVSTNPHPENKKFSAETMAALEQLRYETDAVKKKADAWRLTTAAAELRDFGVLHDFALEHELIRSGAEGDKVWVNPADGSQMVWIPGGSFFIGSNRKRVDCQSFSMGRYPITNAQFKRFLDATDYSPPENHPFPELFLSHWTERTIPKGLDKHPVVYVSYIDALHYCKWANLTLPTEWLWEKAARGVDGRSHPWGDDTGARSRESFANIGTRGTTPVDHYPRTRSAYGCEDMVGNVSEWCQTTPDDNPSAMPSLCPEVEIPEAEDDIPQTVVRGQLFSASARTDHGVLASSPAVDHPSQLLDRLSSGGALAVQTGELNRGLPRSLNRGPPRSLMVLRMNLTSQSLLYRLKRAKPDAADWHRLQDIYLPLIRSWLFRVPGVRDEVEDLTQEVLVVLIRELPRFERQRDGAFRAWLRQITVNRLRAFWKSRQKQPRAGGDDESDRFLGQLEDPNSDLSRQWDRDHDKHVFQQLLATVKSDFEPTTWEAFTRFALEGRPAARVAQELGLTENAIVLAKFRILKRLREEAVELID